MNLDPSNLARRAATWERQNGDLAAATPIKRARVGAGLSQAELARLAGLCLRTVIRAESPNTRVSAGTLGALARVLEVEPWTLRP
jgi:transcriptional regulator with XRE-family HTH domain